MKTPAVVPTWPWVAKAGRSARRHGVYVYQADLLGLTLGASNGSLAGAPLMRYWLHIPREALETRNGFDVADYAASIIRDRVDAGYVMFDVDPAILTKGDPDGSNED